MDASHLLQSSDATVFQTEYGALYDIPWLREFYGRYRLGTCRAVCIKSGRDAAPR